MKTIRKVNKTRLITFFLVLFFSAAPFVIQAADASKTDKTCTFSFTASSGITDANGNSTWNLDCGSNLIGIYMNLLIKYVMRLAIILAVLMLVIGGFQWLLGMGNASKIGNAKQTIIGAILGLFLALGGTFVFQQIDPSFTLFRLNLASVKIDCGKIPDPLGCELGSKGQCHWTCPGGIVIDPNNLIKGCRDTSDAYVEGGKCDEGASMSAQRFLVINGYDLSTYATSPYFFLAIPNIYNNQLNFTMNEANVDNYIQKKFKGSPVTGEMVIASATRYNVDAKLMMAIMQNDSNFGTAGLGAKTNNPGNVGNDDAGNTRTYPTWDQGVAAVAEWLSRHRK